jgi:hypothetical protein
VIHDQFQSAHADLFAYGDAMKAIRDKIGPEKWDKVKDAGHGWFSPKKTMMRHAAREIRGDNLEAASKHGVAIHSKDRNVTHLVSGDPHEEGRWRVTTLGVNRLGDKKKVPLGHYTAPTKRKAIKGALEGAGSGGLKRRIETFSTISTKVNPMSTTTDEFASAHADLFAAPDSLSSNQYYRGVNNKFKNRTKDMHKMGFKYDKEAVGWHHPAGPQKPGERISNEFIMHADKRSFNDRVASHAPKSSSHGEFSALHADCFSHESGHKFVEGPGGYKSHATATDRAHIGALVKGGHVSKDNVGKSFKIKGAKWKVNAVDGGKAHLILSRNEKSDFGDSRERQTHFHLEGSNFSAEPTAKTAADPKAIGKRLTKAVNDKAEVEQEAPVYVAGGKACKDEFAAIHAGMFSVDHEAEIKRLTGLAKALPKGSHERAKHMAMVNFHKVKVGGADLRKVIAEARGTKNDAVVKDNFDGDEAPAPSPTPAKIKNVSGGGSKAVGARITPQGQHGGKGAHFFGAKDEFNKGHAEFAGTMQVGIIGSTPHQKQSDNPWQFMPMAKGEGTPSSPGASVGADGKSTSGKPDAKAPAGGGAPAPEGGIGGGAGNMPADNAPILNDVSVQR